jgi:hypothetical protein
VLRVGSETPAPAALPNARLPPLENSKVIIAGNHRIAHGIHSRRSRNDGTEASFGR